jgi:hypothetical protein
MGSKNGRRVKERRRERGGREKKRGGWRGGSVIINKPPHSVTTAFFPDISLISPSPLLSLITPTSPSSRTLTPILPDYSSTPPSLPPSLPPTAYTESAAQHIHTHLMIPCIIQLAFVSPGCTRALKSTHGRRLITSSEASKSVIVRRGTCMIRKVEGTGRNAEMSDKRTISYTPEKENEFKCNFNTRIGKLMP